MKSFIRELRLRGLNKKQFGLMMGYHPQTIVKWGESPPRWVWYALEGIPLEGTQLSIEERIEKLQREIERLQEIVLMRVRKQ